MQPEPDDRRLPGLSQADHAQNDRMAEFLDLYTRHYPRLQFYVMALLPAASDAADVLQETSLVLWEKFDSFELGTNFFAWACKIARFQTMKHRERSRKAGQCFGEALLEKIAVEASDDRFAEPVSLEALQRCLGKLAEADKTLIRKRYQPGASVQQIAAELGRSANALSKSLGRIRRALVECVERALGQELGGAGSNWPQGQGAKDGGPL